jgi:hypothetical protein
MFVGSNSTSVASRKGLAGRRGEAGLRSPRPVSQNRCCSATGPVGRRSPDPRYRLTLAKLQPKAADADGHLALQSASTSPPALHWLLDLHRRARLRCQHLNDFLGHKGKQGSDDHRNNNVDEWIARDLHRKNVFTGLEQSQCCNRRIAVHGCRDDRQQGVFAPRIKMATVIPTQMAAPNGPPPTFAINASATAAIIAPQTPPARAALKPETPPPQ